MWRFHVSVFPEESGALALSVWDLYFLRCENLDSIELGHIPFFVVKSAQHGTLCRSTAQIPPGLGSRAMYPSSATHELSGPGKVTKQL